MGRLRFLLRRARDGGAGAEPPDEGLTAAEMAALQLAGWDEIVHRRSPDGTGPPFDVSGFGAADSTAGWSIHGGNDC